MNYVFFFVSAKFERIYLLGLSHKLILWENDAHFLLFQYEENGKVSDSMLVNTILMLVYVTKFFWWEAGYWNTMDIAHDRGLRIICLVLSFA